MSRDKQIEEMAKVLCVDYPNCVQCICKSIESIGDGCTTKFDCEKLYNAGYRKTSDVAREVFEEIEKEIKLALDSNYEAKQEHYDNHYRISTEFIGMVCGKIDALRGMQDFLADLKKKYESEGADDDTTR